MMQRSLFDSKPERPSAGAEAAPHSPPRVYSVTQLNAEVKFLLESTFPAIWVEGEISDFNAASSGHLYFCLKDEKSQLRVVMWKSSSRYLRWRPANGMKVMIQGRLVLYEPKGQYQLEVIQIVPHGKGDLYAAFEQMKEKLKAEGLFDTKRKRPIPVLPKKIGIVTSPSGAVIRDILQILNRRYMNLHVLVFPAKVQGEEAARTIVEGIRVLNKSKDMEVIIVARGGGSIEDLWPFNEEIVARAIVGSRIPIISAVGHETDTTIADFAADLRAPTPSAAAELVIGKKSEFVDSVNHNTQRLHGAMKSKLVGWKHQVHGLSRHYALAGVPQKIRQHQQTIDELEIRLANGLRSYHQIQMRRLILLGQKISPVQIRHFIEVKRSEVNRNLNEIRNRVQTKLNTHHKLFALCDGKLRSLNPKAVLERGYSIVLDEADVALRDSSQSEPGKRVRVLLHRGELNCEVKGVKHE